MKRPLLALCAIAASVLPSVAAAETEAGYYAALRAIDAHHQARNMDASARPGIGQFVAHDQRQHFATGSAAFGRAYGNGWRTEGEYVVRRTDAYSSGSTTFASSLNHHDVRSQRLMLNVYRDFALNEAWSVYGTAGAGLSHIQSGGWQGSPNRQYGKASRTGLAWSLGAGISVTAGKNTTVDLGYRYADLGRTESGWNTFANARGLQDEKLQLDLVSREATLGLRYAF
ncbi:porin family protein [Stenotrophomonas maltophilia]|uniref:outer membrane protein n=1 Tax=Stenotrophomonas TaxID=40323 RepID=UPI000D3F7B74|nr:outer membrane protein [Stenotrophomonas maltophilia]MBA0224341.1 porin family protein [Stenotrophomonas maltophilia]MBA0365572.1 porin family protein [Stenotrophomonas maltophilia]MBA0402805.1 porin family protein [Stenotrophomonas maltophilia]MCF3521555.1 outer membrane beta-barrel protein [Stenotrophomonas maltophilia]PSD14108.1 porin family protein [Stenotrophomonas maltophilia]